MSRWAALAGLFLALRALAQPDAVVLVAKPDLVDSNFSATVVLVTHSPTGETVGVVLNHPTQLRLADVAPDFPGAASYGEPLYDGGPVMETVIVAIFHAAAPPAAPAFRVLDDAYVSMHPDNITSLLQRAQGRFRLYAGFSGWAPGQLESEIERDGWYVLPASEEILFRSDTSGMWRELVDKAQRRRAIYFYR
jgi:putative transcriptional regulator